MGKTAVIEETARQLGVTDSAIRQWRSRGKVPHHIRFDLSEKAKRSGHKLKHSDFENFGKL
jgi:transposase-like protein